jgi:hypothetical protein
MLRKLSPWRMLAASPVRPWKPPVRRGVHVVVLIGCDPVVVGHLIVGQIDKQLLQRSIVLGQRIGGRRIVAAVAVREEHLRIVLGGVVELRRAVELIDPGGKVSGEARQRNRPLIPRQDDIGQLTSDRRQVNVFLIRPPGSPGVGQETHKVKLIV